MTGHWEMMGIFTEKPFQTFTDTGFPARSSLPSWKKRCGKRVIGNKSASGTAIIDELGLEEINTGAMIVYTSAPTRCIANLRPRGDPSTCKTCTAAVKSPGS